MRRDIVSGVHLDVCTTTGTAGLARFEATLLIGFEATLIRFEATLVFFRERTFLRTAARTRWGLQSMSRAFWNGHAVPCGAVARGSID